MSMLPTPQNEWLQKNFVYLFISVWSLFAISYIVAVTLTILVLKPDLSNPQVFLPTWWLFAALGILLRPECIKRIRKSF